MSRWKIMCLVLVLGLGIGLIVPISTSWWYDKSQIGNRAYSGDAALVSVKTPPEGEIYHFNLDKDVLSVIEGKPGASGKVIITGLNVHAWPRDILELAPKVEFYSLDEVQSFIDTVNEPLWQE